VRLLVHSYFPLLADHQAGGAQFVMRETLSGLVKHGMEITIICPATNRSDLFSACGVEVLPVLKEKARRPLTLHERAENLHHVAVAANKSDVIWTLDRAFPLRVSQPIVLTLQTVAYEDELNSLLSFNWDVLVVASPYLESLARAVAGPGFWAGVPPPIRVIMNGIDTNFFVSSDPAELRRKLALPSGRYILFPHRPEPAKGFDTALSALRQLVCSGFNYKLLIPTAPQSVAHSLDKERRYYSRLSAKVKRLRLNSSVVFHPWITLKDLPAYYTLGEWCLTLSALPEGFGFTPVQSISCGTPVISTKAGSLRERFPANHGVKYVDVGAAEQVASEVLKSPSRSEIQSGRDYVDAKYSMKRCVEEYLDCFTKAQKKSSRYAPVKSDTLRISPWCYFVGRRVIWHDLYMRRMELSEEEVSVIEQIAEGKDSTTTFQFPDAIQRLMARGLIALIPKSTEE
jgi:glycosyltransferase involved in cell wall biosynthesis